MGKYETNLASEFYVLSTLHRLGADASLTLGNKKSVHIVVVRKAGDAVTVDVKGVAGRWDWPADNIKEPSRPKRHFLVFVSYEGRIDDPNANASIWVVPYPQVERFTKQYRGRRNVSRKLLEDGGKRYRDGWRLLVGR